MDIIRAERKNNTDSLYSQRHYYPSVEMTVYVGLLKLIAECHLEYDVNDSERLEIMMSNQDVQEAQASS